jgi:hypothetical protein
MSRVANFLLPSAHAGGGKPSDFFGWTLTCNANQNSVLVSSREPNQIGKVYVYSYSPGADTFTFYSVLTATNRSSYDQFGYSTAIDSNTPAHFLCSEVGKRRILGFIDPSPGSASESYILTANNYSTQYNRLSGFGLSMSMYDRDLVVGTPLGDPDGNGQQIGSVYYFNINSPGNYTQQQIIRSPSPQVNEFFGIDLDVYNNDMLVGAVGASPGITLNAGRVYYYTKSGGNWNHQQTISNPDGDSSFSIFGYNVAVKGNFAAISAPFITNFDTGFNGKVYFYEKLGGLWINVPSRNLSYRDVVLNSTGIEPLGKNLGLSVALSCNSNMSQAVIVAGAPESYNFDTTLGRTGAVALGVPGSGPWGNSNGYIVNRNPGPLSGSYTNMGRTVSTEFDSRGFVLAGVPLPGKINRYTAGAVYQIRDNFTQDFYPAAEFYDIPQIVTIAGTAMTPVNLSTFKSNSVPVVSYSSANLPAGILLNPTTGELTGTIALIGTYSSTVVCSNVAGKKTNVPISFRTVQTNINYGPISSDKPISIGGTAVGSGGGSLNLLLNRSLGQANSQLSEIETRASHPMSLTTISDPQGTGTGVCVPRQIEKYGTSDSGGTNNWFPSGVGGTYRPHRMSEFRAAYRWGMANVKAFNYTSRYTQNFTCGSKRRGPCPGFATLTMTANTPGSPGGSPYYWLFITPGSSDYALQRGTNSYTTPGNWSTILGGWVTAGAGVDTYVKYPAGNQTDPPSSKNTRYVYTVRLKDSQGCGLIGNIAAPVTVTYPQAISG